MTADYVRNHRERTQDLAWQAEAACRGVDPDLFFPEKGESLEPARAVCAKCAVREECLEYSLDGSEKHGVWASTSERQRRTMRAARHRERRMMEAS